MKVVVITLGLNKLKASLNKQAMNIVKLRAKLKRKVKTRP